MVHIVQCLCPARHCIVALAYESERIEPAYSDQLDKVIAEAVRGGLIDPYCGLCLAPRELWRTEDRATAYGTLLECWIAAHNKEEWSATAFIAWAKAIEALAERIEARYFEMWPV